MSIMPMNNDPFKERKEKIVGKIIDNYDVDKTREKSEESDFRKMANNSRAREGCRPIDLIEND